MNINKASELLNDLLSQADKKSKKKVYNCFIRTLSSLEKRDLSENQSRLIQEKLSALNLEATTENKKKYYNQKHADFVAFLKEEFSFTAKNHYRELGMIYGMIFGSGLGLTIGVAIDPSLGTSIGLSMGVGIGMVFGMLFGAQKDAEAKKQGTML
jgi:hypothetical protein